MQWTASPIRQRTAANRIPLIWAIKTLASNLCAKENEPLNESEIQQLLNRVPDSNVFTINYEAQKIILNLRNDSSSGQFNIPVKFLKPVLEQITSTIVLIINTSIDKEIFPDSWKVVRVCPIARTHNHLTVRLSASIYFSCFIQSIWKSNIESTSELHRKVCCLQPYPVWFS